jgi:hypothetical protein
MGMKWHGSFVALAGLIATGFCTAAHAGAESDLAGQTDLTPENLIRSFAGFKFELSAQPQDAETFLQRKRGDCDDFAALASRLLAERGYKTKVVVVMMNQQTHVVCYVKEAHGFLDFNHRADAQPIIESNGSLEDIAEKVAGDFRAPWHMASEIKYENKAPVYLEVVFPSVAAAKKPVTTVVPAAPQKRNGTNDLDSPRPVSSAPTIPNKIAQGGNPGLLGRNSP